MVWINYKFIGAGRDDSIHNIHTTWKQVNANYDKIKANWREIHTAPDCDITLDKNEYFEVKEMGSINGMNLDKTPDNLTQLTNKNRVLKDDEEFTKSDSDNTSSESSSSSDCDNQS